MHMLLIMNAFRYKLALWCDSTIRKTTSLDIRQFFLLHTSGLSLLSKTY